MKAKSRCLLLALTAVCLAALPLASRCQVVGYQPVSIVAGYNFVANPFDTGDNTLAGVVSPSYPPLGTAVYLWNVTNQQYRAPSLYSTNGWTTNLSVPPGTGFVIYSTNGWTLTFTGNVLEGTRTNFCAGGYKFSLLASAFPVNDTLTGPTMTFPGLEGENVFLYSSGRRDFLDSFTFYGAYGWYDPAKAYGAAGPIINIGQSFVVQNPGPDMNWVQTYTLPASQAMSQSGPKASIQGIRAAGGKVILGILNPAGATYSVQFSADRSVWTTLATKQTGTPWTGPVPDKPPGFYRLTSP
jgi:hypothetical protein